MLTLFYKVIYLVSIIVPVYNGAKFIENFIASIEKQTYNDLEVVFVNDGSMDNSFEILNEYRQKAAFKMQVINKKNSGVSVARNVGVISARGRYLSFCDVDDDIAGTYVEDLLSGITKYEADLIICKAVFMKKSGEIISDKVKNNIKVVDSITCLKDFLYGRITSGCCTIMVKRDLLLNNQIKFPEGSAYNEDLHMLWRIIAFSRRIVYLDKNLYFYNQQEDSAMSNFCTRRLDGFRLMKELEKFFEINQPSFSREYNRYGAARVMWSLTWQASMFLDKKNFKDFIKNNNVKAQMRKLLTFKQIKVALSAIVFLISPDFFRYAVINFGKSRYH